MIARASHRTPHFFLLYNVERKRTANSCSRTKIIKKYQNRIISVHSAIADDMRRLGKTCIDRNYKATNLHNMAKEQQWLTQNTSFEQIHKQRRFACLLQKTRLPVWLMLNLIGFMVNGSEKCTHNILCGK